MDKFERLITLEEYISHGQNRFKGATGELSQLLRDISLAAKIISREVNKAGITNILGPDGSVNIHGENVKRLDVFANDQLINALSKSNNVCLMVSEESEGIIRLRNSSAKYIVYVDPLDGSSNIDVNVSIGTIFSIYSRLSNQADEPNLNDVLQQGIHQVAAGYILYGSNTMLVYTTGMGVSIFTLDPGIGEFLLSEDQIQMPDNGSIISINEGNYATFSTGLKQYLVHCKMNDPSSGKPYMSRYIGSMVSDVHRTLIKGGAFIYPESLKLKRGKLRLMYECNPMAFLIEQAGGIAIDGKKRILDIKPAEIHERCPVYMGSRKNMAELVGFLRITANKTPA